MAYGILFVCLGNICRSPTAEAVTRVKADRLGLNLRLDSAGTGDWHIGKPPYGPMQTAALGSGYDLSDLRARQVTRADEDAFDLILAMDADNQRDLAAIGITSTLFTDYARMPAVTDVPDPYFTRDFSGALELIERCADGLLATLDAR